MITRLLVGMFTPAMRATGQSPFQPRAILRGGCTHPSVRWRPAPAELTPNAKSPMRSLPAPGPRTRSGWRSYRVRVGGRQPALARVGADRRAREACRGGQVPSATEAGILAASPLGDGTRFASTRWTGSALGGPRMKTATMTAIGALLLIGAVAAGAIYFEWNEAVPIVAMGVNYFRYLSAPNGTLTTETAPGAAAGRGGAGTSAPATSDDWPSYNKTLTSDRFSSLDQITNDNVGELRILCTYDTGQYTGFNSGILEVEGSLIFTTEYDIFSIDPNNCRQNWRTHEDYSPATPQDVSRGAAYLDGMLFRGSQDGRVLAFDFKTGKRLWETQVADPKKGETTPAAPIAWNGLVFIGNAGGDVKGVKGRMYALDARSGKIVWEFYLVPKAEGDPTR